MKALIATSCVATCVAVLAMTGYFFYGEYAEARAQTERQARVDDAMLWLYTLSEAEKGDTSRVAQFCDNVRNYRPMRESAKKLGADRACIVAGL